MTFLISTLLLLKKKKKIHAYYRKIQEMVNINPL